ncbi:1-aminocyclopropane-1-carboxylate synthase 1 [Zopfia rhizophila CBS 207.26]|uniref:1-aminocyclopropane-1-carboxylate synthase 1 n=1 Tax=Zopfia rhizophila CBS 207.26 TaxID=1314779 RepID=A0A6A6ENU5_9PEZI|nr:1-aminocyclopropane-1-carboxylate synthase 1 [Zopfia rhizophila CBS 207.26]
MASKWHPDTNPDGMVNLGTAENHLMLNDIADFINSKGLHLEGKDFDYGEGPWGSVRLRKGMAKFINRHFHPFSPVDADELTFANGCTSLFNMLRMTIADPEDGLLLSMPGYIAFPTDFSLLAKMKPVFVPFHGADQFSLDAVTHYEEAYRKAEESGTRIRALMLCNPHNPLGKCYPKETLIALMKFCQQRKVHLLADEVYAMSVYEVPEPSATPFISVLSFDYSRYINRDYLHFIYGMAKDFACGGLRMGALWTKNKELARAVATINQFRWPGQVDERVAAKILEDEEWLDSFLTKSRERLAASNKLARQLMDYAGIGYASGANAGLFFWIDLSPWLNEDDGKDDWEREERLVKRMLENKVFLTNGKGQASERPGFFRPVFSREERMLREGFRRLVNTLEEN